MIRMTALPHTSAVRRVLPVDLTPVPLVGVAVDVPGWADPQTCGVCWHAYDAAATVPCPHTSDPLCSECAEDCRRCWALAQQEVDGL